MHVDAGRGHAGDERSGEKARGAGRLVGVGGGGADGRFWMGGVGVDVQVCPVVLVLEVVQDLEGEMVVGRGVGVCGGGGGAEEGGDCGGGGGGG